jgi:hypothetical protein
MIANDPIQEVFKLNFVKINKFLRRFFPKNSKSSRIHTTTTKTSKNFGGKETTIWKRKSIRKLKKKTPRSLMFFRKHQDPSCEVGGNNLGSSTSHLWVHLSLGLPRRCVEIVRIWTFKTLGVHNSLFRPSVGMRFQANS